MIIRNVLFVLEKAVVILITLLFIYMLISGGCSLFGISHPWPHPVR